MNFKVTFTCSRGNYAIVFYVQDATELEICVGSHILSARQQGIFVRLLSVTRID